MNRVLFRKIHRKLAPIIFIPLLLSALTGIIYRIGKSWFGMSSETADIFMVIHQGEYLGDQIKPIYVLLLGLGLIGMIVSGFTMIRRFSSDRPPSAIDVRKIHRLLAPIFFLPLVVSALSGISYRLGKSWLGMSSEQAEIFMTIHQGSYLGSLLKPIYVLLVGLGLLGLIATGIKMLGWFRKNQGSKAL
ncbi:MAG: PepSY domain-containing protein [Hormoscilla sp. GM7CHS1pb]|nr:PepSY domain-containing protein [Hormoscilla sp. GM7CHS1pb]